MSVICPTVLANNPHDFRTQIERVAPFAERIQIDLSDGVFSPTTTIAPIQAWWPENIVADIHLMFAKPLEQIETLVSLKPNMVIIHAEAQGDLRGMMEHLQKMGIKAGVALLADTTVESAQELIETADHVLLFAGHLGSFGGDADLNVLNKVDEVKALKPDVEIGWDGGANMDNAAQLAHGGIDVINVGSGIQRADDSAEAYRKLVEIIS